MRNHNESGKALNVNSIHVRNKHSRCTGRNLTPLESVIRLRTIKQKRIAGVGRGYRHRRHSLGEQGIAAAAISGAMVYIANFAEELVDFIKMMDEILNCSFQICNESRYLQKKSMLKFSFMI